MQQSIHTQQSSAPAYETLALQLLRRAFGNKARVRLANPPQHPNDHGWQVEIKLLSHKPRLLRLDYPRDPASSRGKHVIWVLTDSTPKQRQLLRSEHQNFIDFSGAVHLELPEIILDRTDLLPVRPPTATTDLDPFADRASLVVRTLLTSSTRKEWGVRELAAQAGVDPGTSSRVTRSLARLGLVAHQRIGRGSRIRLEEPRRLLDRWAFAYDFSRNRSLAVHAPIGDERRFLDRLEQHLGGRRWALTLGAGARLVAPHASSDRIHVYIDVAGASDLVNIAVNAEWEAGRDGRLVLLKPVYRKSVWHALRVVDGKPVVSDLQLVLDLWHYPLRGQEQAQHIVETVLQPVWDG